MEENKRKAVRVHYHKNPLYRTIYSDGIIGGTTPANQINISFYATRNTIPKSVDFELTDEGGLGKKIAVSGDSKVGVIKEIELGVYMSRQAAKGLYEFLKKALNEK